MRDLAHKLGIEAASLYSHIKSKEEIHQSLCFDMATEFKKSLMEVEKKNVPASEKLKLGIIGHIQVMAKDLTASAVFMNEHRHLSQPHLRDFQLRHDVAPADTAIEPPQEPLAPEVDDVTKEPSERART